MAELPLISDKEILSACEKLTKLCRIEHIEGANKGLDAATWVVVRMLIKTQRDADQKILDQAREEVAREIFKEIEEIYGEDFDADRSYRFAE